MLLQHTKHNARYWTKQTGPCAYGKYYLMERQTANQHEILKITTMTQNMEERWSTLGKHTRGIWPSLRVPGKIPWENNIWAVIWVVIVVKNTQVQEDMTGWAPCEGREPVGLSMKALTGGQWGWIYEWRARFQTFQWGSAQIMAHCLFS